MSYEPQDEDYFTLTGVGFDSNGTLASDAPADVTNTTPSYTTVMKGNTQELGYTFLYWNGVAYDNPITGGVPYVGASAINGMSLVIDSITIDNNSTTDITVDILRANPANLKKSGQNIIPPSKIKRVTVAAGKTETLHKGQMQAPLLTSSAQTQTEPYYMIGDGLAVAFPDSVTTSTVSGTTTYSNSYGVYNVDINALVHYEP